MMLINIQYTENGVIDSLLEQQLDHYIYHFYNLTYDEALLIDPDIASPSRAYPVTRDMYDTFSWEKAEKELKKTS